MEITGITVCYGFSDVLTHTLEDNLRLLSRWYIITSTLDIDTINLIRSKNDPKLELIYYPIDKDHSKARAINYAQKIIHIKHKNSFMLILDADILIPQESQQEIISIINSRNICLKSLYSAPRYILPNLEDYYAFINKTSKKAIKDGPKWLGFFQLYFDKDMYYPDNISGWKGDIEFLYKFIDNRLKKLKKYTIHIGPTKRWKSEKYYNGITKYDTTSTNI